MIKKLTSLFVTIAMLCVFIPTSVMAATSGSCGDTATWTYADGTLTISGTGVTGDYIYDTQPWKSVRSSITTVIVEDGITAIGQKNFYYLPSLSSVTIADSVTSIGSQAFDTCASLTELDTGNGITTIASDAFDKTNLKTLKVSGAMTTIPYEQFAPYKNLEKIVIKSGVTTIGSGAFRNCSSLKVVELPNTLTKINAAAFENCSAITDIYYWGTQEQKKSLSIVSDRNTYLINATVHYTFTAALNTNGGTCDVTSLQLCFGEEYGDLPAPKKSGYIFKGWFTASTGGTKVTAKTIYNSESDTTLYAQWESGTGGVCGSYASWGYKDGVLTIEGTGAINDYIYDTQPWGSVRSNITDVVISDGITVIGEKNFYYFSNLKSVSIPDTVKTISSESFNYCTSLFEIDTGDGVTSIATNAFDKDVLKSLTLSDSLTSTVYENFANCTALESVIIGNGTNTLGPRTFYNCTSLKSIELTSTTTSLSANAFGNCSALTDVYYWGTDSEYAQISKEYGNTTFTSATVHYLREVTLNANGGTVKNELHRAILNESYGELEIPSRDGYIFEGWFTLPEGGEKITENTVFTEGETTLYAHWREGISGFCGDNTVWVYENNTLTISGYGDMYDYTQDTAPWALYKDSITDVIIDNNITSIGAYAFYDCRMLENVSISDSVLTISAYAFAECPALSYIDTAEVTAIANYAFDVNNLKSIIISGNITSISYEKFAPYAGLENVIIQEGTQTLVGGSFRYCSSLKTIEFPNSLTSIGGNSFVNSSEITDVYYRGSSSEWSSVNKNYGNSYITNANIHYIITVSFNTAGGVCDTLNINAENGKTFGELPTPFKPGYIFNGWFTEPVDGEEITNDTICNSTENITLYAQYTADNYGTCGENATWIFEDGILTISGSGNMSDYTQDTAPWEDLKAYITSVVIEDGIIGIGSYSFYGCDSLTNVETADSVLTISEGAFDNCSSLSAIKIGNGVTVIEANAFDKTNLKSLELSDAMETIDAQLFTGYTGLENVVFGENTTTIEDQAFYGCSSLTSIEFPKTLTMVKENAFADCNALTNIYYSGDLSDWNSIGIESGNDVLNSATIQYMFTVSFDANGGTCETESIVAATGKTYGELPLPQKSGYIFAGWYTDLTSGTQITSNTICTANTNHTLYAQWVSSVSGTCGDTAKWICEGNTLTIYGSGDMYDYIYDTQPWGSVRNYIKKVVVSDGITSIGEKAFYYLQSLEDVSIADSVTTISTQAFNYCPSLLEIDTGDGVTSIEANAFSKSVLKSLTLSDKLTTTIYKNFANCTALESVVIGSGTTTLGPRTFYNCISLKDIELTSTTTTIGANSFGGCTALNDVYFRGTQTQWAAISKDYGNTVLDTATVHYIATLFFDANGGECDESGKTITLGETYGKLPVPQKDNHEFIGWYTSLTNGETVSAETVCTESTDVTVYAMWKESTSGNCGENAQWSYEDGVLTITGEGDMYDYSEGATPWNSYIAEITTVELSNDITHIGAYTFNNISIAEIALPTECVSIGTNAFTGCNLSLVEIPESVTEISDNAFDSENMLMLGYNDIAKTYADNYNIKYIDMTSISVSCNLDSGTHYLNDVDSITISSNQENTVIRYTLDSTAPDCNSDIYSSPISVAEGDMTLKFALYANDRQISDIFTYSYSFVKAPSVIGDNNSDGEVSLADLLRLTQYLTGYDITFTEQELSSCDVNADGYVNEKDAMKLSRYLSGWDSIMLGERD